MDGRSTSLPEKVRKIRVFVLIDALGWEFLKNREFLSDILPYRRSLRTVLGFSSGAIPTILTGVPPAKSGHWNLYYFDPKNSPFRWLRLFGFLPHALLDHRVSRKIVKELGRRVLGMGPVFECCVSPGLLPWFNWVERRNIYEEKGISGAPSIFDQLSRLGIPYRAYSYHKHTDQEILRLAARDLESGAADFFFVYLSEMDSFLHMHVKDDKSESAARLAWYESRLRDLFELAQHIDPEAEFAVFSDHGMTPVGERHDLVRDIKALSLRVPQDYLSVYDSTMARFWFFSESARQSITEHLKTLTYGRILQDDELRQLGVFFPDSRFGELIFLLNAGHMIASSDFNGRGWIPNGMHGYHPDDPYSDAIYLSNRAPLFDMQSIADIYRCMAHSFPDTVTASKSVMGEAAPGTAGQFKEADAGRS